MRRPVTTSRRSQGRPGRGYATTDTSAAPQGGEREALRDVRRGHPEGESSTSPRRTGCVVLEVKDGEFDSSIGPPNESAVGRRALRLRRAGDRSRRPGRGESACSFSRRGRDRHHRGLVLPPAIMLTVWHPLARRRTWPATAPSRRSGVENAEVGRRADHDLLRVRVADPAGQNWPRSARTGCVLLGHAEAIRDGSTRCMMRRMVTEVAVRAGAAQQEPMTSPGR